MPTHIAPMLAVTDGNAAIAFYQGPSWLLPASFALLVFTSSAADVVISAFSAELFPTSQRGASSALEQAME